MKHSEEFLAIVNDAKSRVKETDVPGARTLVANGAKLIDVREDNEWNDSHAAGATHIGRGVIEMSALEYMLYHQNNLALVKLGSRRLASSHSLSPWTSWLLWRHSQTWAKSRKYQPLPTTPCSLGSLPVTNVDCTEQVTAGKIVVNGRRA